MLLGLENRCVKTDMRSHRDLVIFIAVDQMQISNISSVFIGCRASAVAAAVRVLASESSTTMRMTDVFLVAPYTKINHQSPPQHNTNRWSIINHFHDAICAKNKWKIPKIDM